jgi:Flp pilus assembly protein TadD
LKSLEKCLQVKPDFLPALKDQGLILLRKGQNAAALASFRKAVQVSPDTPEFHLNSGIALKNLGRVGEAIACY